ncbi:alpha/beta hydrolase [Aspergillus clavatus NRRL 1]|uniref:Phospholipase/carboxylesterase, putative n=1 Tax=Aspergillus clavatus (strain ATCC 1007 / CBS 513.65 / DSM 816 / NCTC 3887 / NRRL 1 / QM 1276 / 107) TaxID=344612 RepID=A1CNJ5_ASPCL|nr:phospholipase/carboxylesterase, putative [Aspergillus clavatus NRRL 1]EAW07216.1 phospholipase/carboxylesterase, putative [Aspergillus clavatus NRRL 1]
MPSSKPYPPPLIIPPLHQDQHTHTLILLHGRGSNSERFGRVFLDSTGLAKRLPTTRFIFPTARKRRSTVLKRIPINQWFDNYSLEDPNTRTELQLDGLQESSEFLRQLVDAEAGLLSTATGLAVGEAYLRVVLGGLSQGCAASVFCLLGGWLSGGEEGQGRRLGGFVGMSGWLPFEGEIAGVLKMSAGESDSEAEDDEDDPFARDADGDDVPAHVQAVNHIRDILGMPAIPSDAEDSETAFLKTPVFLGHGAADAKVSVDLGRRMAATLSDGFGMDVTWKPYEDFGHWYKVPDEIDDAMRFLQEKVGFAVVEAVEESV